MTGGAPGPKKTKLVNIIKKARVYDGYVMIYLKSMANLLGQRVFIMSYRPTYYSCKLGQQRVWLSLNTETHPCVKWIMTCIKRKIDRSLHGFLHRGYLPCSGTNENQLLDFGVPTDKPFGEIAIVQMKNKRRNGQPINQ